MINNETIEEVKNRLVKTYNPVAIYLFGSYAWGNPTEDSDLDLLIVVDWSSKKSYDRARSGYRALRGLDVSKDIIVYTQQEFASQLNKKSSLGYKIKKAGKILYARA